MEFLRPNKYKIIATIFFVLCNLFLIGFLFCGFAPSDPFCNNFFIKSWIYVLGAPLFTFLIYFGEDILGTFLILIIILQIIWAYLLGCLTVALIKNWYINKNKLIIGIILLLFIAFILITPIPLIIDLVKSRF